MSTSDPKKNQASSLTKLLIWEKLQQHYKTFKDFSLAKEFKESSDRCKKMTLKLDALSVDFSKNYLTPTTLQLLVELAETQQIKQQINNLFSGGIVNYSEQRAATHTVFREASAHSPEVLTALDKIRSFTEKIRSQQWHGFSGKPITDVVNLGTGGSYLGPYMSSQALKKFSDSSIKLHFFANQHDEVFQRLLNHLDPETTLFLVSSKSFSTHETLHNFSQALAWLKSYTIEEFASKQFIAITANPEKALALGINSDHILTFPITVGGRYSIWSAIGLPLCIKIGFKRFKEFLAGAAKMDQHFLQTPITENIPIILALIEIWYINFFAVPCSAILPYHQDLYLLPRYLQQLSMESLGKQITQDGELVSYNTGNIIWGGVGSTGQHAYHQLLHQGTQFIPCDFIATFSDSYLFSQCLAQSSALMMGEINESQCKICPGNRPSTIIVMPELSPSSLGMLLALYEHKIFTQAAIWNINPFDQWGVEYGKQLGQAIENIVKYQKMPNNFDASTLALLNEYIRYTKG